MKPIVTILLAAVLLAGCGGGSTTDQPGQPPSGGAQTGDAKPAQPKTLAWGQPAAIEGDKGGRLRATPVGVLYHRGPYRGVDGPENGWFVAIAIKVEALGRPDTTAAPISGGGFQWRGGGQTISGVEGNANSTPWVGAVNGFGVDSPIEPASPEFGVETFDVPAKAGGRLIYVNPSDQAITSWPLPAADQGTGLTKVRKRIRMFS